MKIDARKLDTQAQQEKRNIAIKLREEGMKNQDVAYAVGVHPSTVSKWWGHYKKNEKSLLIRQRGRRIGANRRLSDDEEQAIIRLLMEKNDLQLQFKYTLWTCDAVSALIKLELNKNLSISTVGKYLKKWQFTPKNPTHRASSQKDKKALKWIKEEYPRIKKQAKTDYAEIWWAQETSCAPLLTNPEK